jgi:hypothetical protein
MHNNPGDSDEQLSADESSGIAVRKTFEAKGILAKALGRDVATDGTAPADDGSARTLPTEVRRVRRGKFFLSDYEQTANASLKRPIFEYWGHGVVVGETVRDSEKSGQWCYAAHPDFDLIPEFQSLSVWPEYTRTPTGWVRSDGARRFEQKDEQKKKETYLNFRNMIQKRLR